MAFTNTSRALRQIGGLVVSRLADGLRDTNAIASGQLEESIDFRAYERSSVLGVDITMLDYWQFVDEGRKAGKRPPVSKIEEWLSYPNVRDKIRFGQSDAPIKDIQSAAYIIAKKIGEKGTKGNNFATNVFESKLITSEVPSLIEESVGKDIEAILDEVFNIG